MDLCFVLVRPSFLGNIGSTARVLKNFSFVNLRLVAPPKNYKDAEARKMSLGAFDLLKNAQVFETLQEALKDVDYTIGSSCGTQREIKLVSLSALPDLLSQVKSHSKRIAFIFGEERDGLSKEELNRCDIVVSIPTNPDFPSLNVSQAIGVFAYELSKWNVAEPDYQSSSASLPVGGDTRFAPGSLPASEDALARELQLGIETDHYNQVSHPSENFTTGQMDDEFFAQLDLLLHEVGFSRSFNRESVLAELRQLYQRAKPSTREYGMLQGMIRKINSKLNFENS
ncbi:MAG: hypothetical protein K2X77_08875 [Candidatus Obscuribacterales bacterium]|jgi:TrmH family RNA methyltransferase|nr:hypothetical protein [Candidatus Obscuribacterales bacterium]